jgi:uncharacterized membrane protein YuzA (DUF378 family)
MSPDILAVMIPLSAIILGISAGIVGIVAKHRQQVQRADLRHRERLAAMDKGVELPPELEDPVDRPRYLLKGLVWGFIGIACYFALNALAGSEESLLAGIPFAIGLAYLIYYFVQGRHEDAAALEKMKAKQP